MCTIAPEPLLSLVAAMSAAHPLVALEILDSTALALEEQLIAGDLDIALYCKPGTRDGKLSYLKVFSERMLVVLAPGDPLAARARAAARRAQRPALPQSRELRVPRFGRVERPRRAMAGGLPQRPRRLDPGDGRGGHGLRLPAGAQRDASRRRHAPPDSGGGARGRSRLRPRPPPRERRRRPSSARVMRTKWGEGPFRSSSTP